MRRVEIDAATARLDEELRRWAASSAGADPGFVAAKRQERAALDDEKRALDRPWTPPAAGSYFTNRLIPLRRSLPRDEKTAGGDARARRRGRGDQPAQRAAARRRAEPGRAFYVGDAKCGPATSRRSRSGRRPCTRSAWKTLVEVGKENDYKCIGCHVTGYGQVGGTSLGHTKRLRDVQCEVCHGPGSIHVAEKGLEDPASVHKEAPASTCIGCHTEQHSDTFQYEAYLRDILGAGHGAAARAKLGDGPTGHALRSAALARAKAAGAAEANKL